MGGGLKIESFVLQKSKKKTEEGFVCEFKFLYSITRKPKTVKGLSHSIKEILSHNGVGVFHRLHNYMHIYKHTYLFKKRVVKAD